MDYLPLFLRLQGASVLVVGGGEVATRKVALLEACGARITLVAPALAPALATAVAEGRITHDPQPFSAQSLSGVRLVVAATDDEAVNAAVAAAGAAAGVLVNVVDSPDVSNCIVPAIIDRSPIVVACSTGGAAPVLATELRAQLETLLPPRLGELGAFTRERRPRVKRVLPDIRARRLFWLGILRGPVARAVLAGETDHAETLFQAALAAPTSPPRPCCVLVGIRSDDPDWLPLGALRRLFMADRVVADPDIPEALVALSRRDAEHQRLPQLTAPADFVTARLEELAPVGEADTVTVYLSRQNAAALAELATALRARACLTELWSAP